MNIRRLNTIILLVLVAAMTIFAEDFGRNKVQYDYTKWKYFESDDFRLYYAEGYSGLAHFAVGVLEEAYVRVSSDVGHGITERIPVVIYPSPSDFQETNITMSILGEGVGGFTESFKTRVVLPFDGSYEDFRHVLVHEMAHGVVFDKLLGRGPISAFSSRRVFQMPMWLAEGISEWESICWDVESDMYLRDAIVNDYAVPLERLSGFLAYKEGASVVGYLARRYGRRKIGEILGKGQVHITPDGALKSAIGKDQKQLYEDWLETKKREYFPEYGFRKRPEDIAERITDHTKDRSYFNVMPAFSPDGHSVAFLSNAKDLVDLYIVDVITGKRKRIARGQTKGSAESFHPFRSRPGWSEKGEYLAYSRKHGGSDEIAIRSAKDWKLFRTMAFEGLKEISSPTFVRGDTAIVFSALSKDRSDLYIARFDGTSPKKITDDRWDDKMPSVSPDGRYIAFSSDRPVDGGRGVSSGNDGQLSSEPIEGEFPFGHYNIWIYDIEADSFAPFTVDGLGNDQPAFSPDGNRIAWTSEANGIRNIWIAYLDEPHRDRPYTDLLSGAFTPTWDPDGKSLVFSAFDDAGFDLFVMREFSPLDSLVETPYFLGRDTMCLFDEAQAKDFPYRGGDLRDYRAPAGDEAPDSTERNYTPQFSVDMVTGVVGYDTYYGFVGQSYLSLSDVLGNQQIDLSTDLFDDIENSTIFVSYRYLAHRTNFGASAYHYKDYFWDNRDRIFSDRVMGASVSVEYPFSQFDRIEATVGGTYIERDFLGVPVGDEWPASEKPFNARLSAGAVRDNSLWGNTGPLAGSRLKVAAEYVPNISGSAMDFYAGRFDLRRYIHFGSGYSLAMRGAAGAARGKKPPQYWLGGSSQWLNYRVANDDIYSIGNIYYSRMILPLRGYDYFEYSGQTYAIANLEFRYPFVQYLKLGMPPVTIGGINGAIFMDVGAVAGTDLHDFRGWKDSRLDDIKMGVGIGARAWFWWLLFDYDLAWKTDIAGIAPKPYHHISLGAEF